MGFSPRIAEGANSEEAGLEFGAAQAVGTRWFYQAGGLPPINVCRAAGPVFVVRRVRGDGADGFQILFNVF